MKKRLLSFCFILIFLAMVIFSIGTVSATTDRYPNKRSIEIYDEDGGWLEWGPGKVLEEGSYQGTINGPNDEDCISIKVEDNDVIGVAIEGNFEREDRNTHICVDVFCPIPSRNDYSGYEHDGYEDLHDSIRLDIEQQTKTTSYGASRNDYFTIMIESYDRVIGWHLVIKKNPEQGENFPLVTNLQSKVENIKEKLEKKNSHIDTLKDRVSSLEDQISKMRTRLTNKDSVISVLRENISEFQSRVSSLKDTIEQKNERIATLEERSMTIKVVIEPEDGDFNAGESATAKATRDGKPVSRVDIQGFGSTVSTGSKGKATFQLSESGKHEIEVSYAGTSTTKTINVKPSGLARFKMTNVSVEDRTVEVGEFTTITLEVKNTGKKKGTHTVKISIGDEVKSKEVTLDPGEADSVSFKVSKQKTGTFDVKAGDLSETLRVTEAEGGLPLMWIGFMIAVVIVGGVAFLAGRKT